MSRLVRRGVLAGGGVIPGQEQWTTQGTYSFEVPAGVTRLWAALSGATGGGCSNSVTSGRRKAASGGAGFAFCCLIVEPGDLLSVEVGIAGLAGSGSNQGGNNGGLTRVLRSGTSLIQVNGSSGGAAKLSGDITRSAGGIGLPLTGYDTGLASGGYEGGGGGYGETDGAPGGGGGAAGYSGNGGAGSPYGSLAASAAAAGSGGGGGGLGGYGGGGVGLLGKGADGAAGTGTGATAGGRGGSGGADAGSASQGGLFGGGSAPGAAGRAGAVRFMWGGEIGGQPRSYPTNAGNV